MNGWNYNMTQEEKNNLTKLNNLELVEELLKYQQDVDRYHQKRAESEYQAEEWFKYHELMYQAIEDVITIKYMIVRRMGSLTGYGNV